MTARHSRWRSALTYLALAVLVVTAGAWALGRFVLEPPVQFPALSGIDRVAVAVGGGDEPGHDIIDPAQVAALVGFADDMRGDWHGTWHTMPSPPVHACFFHGGELRYCIGAGREILAVWSAEHRGLQDATPDQTRRFAALAGVPETMLDRW